MSEHTEHLSFENTLSFPFYSNRLILHETQLHDGVYVVDVKLMMKRKTDSGAEYY